MSTFAYNDMTTFARIPRELITDGCELWISFINPTSEINNSPGWWKFGISSHEPQIEAQIEAMLEAKRFARS